MPHPDPTPDHCPACGQPCEPAGCACERARERDEAERQAVVVALWCATAVDEGGETAF